MQQEAFLQDVKARLLSGRAIPLALRWLVAAGLLFHFLLTSGQNSSTDNLLWFILLLFLAGYSLLVTYAAWQKPELDEKREWIFFQFIFEIFLFSLFYLLAAEPASSLYLLYFLPILTLSENFKIREALALFLLLSGVILVVFLLHDLRLTTTFSAFDYFLNIFLPRWAFFLLVLLLSSLRHETLTTQAEELAALHETTLHIANKEDLDLRLDAILDAALELLNATGCKVYLKVPEQPLLEMVAAKGIAGMGGHFHPLDRGLIGKVFTGRQAIIENDISPNLAAAPSVSSSAKSILGLPLLFAQQPIGVLLITDNSGKRTFTRQDFSPAKRLAQFAAVAIWDRQLAERERLQAQVLAELNTAAAAMNAHLNIQDILAAVCFHAWRLATYYHVSPPLFTGIGLVNATGSELLLETTYPAGHLDQLPEEATKISLKRSSTGLINAVVQSAATRVVNDPAETSDSAPLDHQASSQLAVPILKGDKLLGVLTIEHAERYAFEQELQKHLEVLVAHAATAIENAHLFRRMETQQALATELHEASLAMATNGRHSTQEIAQSVLDELPQILPFTNASFQVREDGKWEVLAALQAPGTNGKNDPGWPLEDNEFIRRVIAANRIHIISPAGAAEARSAAPLRPGVKGWVGIPLPNADDEVMGIIAIENENDAVDYAVYRNLIELFAIHATSVFQNDFLRAQNEKRVQELTVTKEILETVLENYKKYENLALVGLIFGETFHFARSRLGMAKTKADNIALGYYGAVTDEQKENAQKIVSYIDDYLQVLERSRKDAVTSPEPKPLDIHQALREVVSAKNISPLVAVNTQFQARNPVVIAPIQQLRQVFYVIIQNALDAMKMDGGELRLETCEVSDERGDFLKITVSDSGRGIPRHVARHLFEMRPEGRPRGKGTGMGLFWARSFIRSYGGDIDFTSVVGEGTDMIIEIPRSFHATLSIPTNVVES